MSEKKQPIDSHVHFEVEPEINKYFKLAIKAKATDLHLKVGQPPKLRISEDIKGTTAEPFTEDKIEKLVFEILTEKQKHFFLENGTLDFVYEAGSADRFRVNIFRQRTKISLSARKITSEIPAFESLHLPPMVKTIAETSYEGLILVTGSAGCGKSTTIAAMIDLINRTRACHIITIEDPLEFVYTDKKAIVSQREVGIDVADIEDALKSLARQDPDVVMISEIKDQKTFSAAMRAAETGHLVFGTMLSVSASQTIQRILDLYPPEERDLARQTLATTLKAVINQMLLPGIKKDTPRVPAVEILISNPIAKKLILEKRENSLDGVIKSCQKEGMQDLTESLHLLVEGDWIDMKVALQNAPNLDELKMALKGIRSTSTGVL